MKTTLILSVLAVLILVAAVLSIIDKRAAIGSKFDQFALKLRGAARSKTVWFNALVLIFIQQLPGFIDYLAQNMVALQPYLPASHAQTIIGAITIANVILRFKTTHPLEAK